ncbi:MAG: sulfotransferase domain-containing protein [Vicinamibacterales bacterium]
MGTLVWLVSYPKSGNTWLRALLTNYTRNASVPASINAMDPIYSAGDRAFFDEMVGVEASDLTPAEVQRYRASTFVHAAGEVEGTLFVKVHDARRLTDSGCPNLDLGGSSRVIYVVRSPLDVVVSLAHHEGTDVETAVGKLCTGHVLASSAGRGREQLEQPLDSWSAHVRSWVDDPGARAHVVRYEDLVANPHVAFSSILRSIGWRPDSWRLARAIDQSQFETLRAQEQAQGFRERPRTSTTFFRRGTPGEWREALSPGQVRRIVAVHGEVMRRFLYLDENGEPS